MTPARRPHPEYHPGYGETFERTPAAVSISRDLVRDALGVWEVDDYTVQAAALVVSELVTNVIRHTASRLLLVIVEQPMDTRVRLAVVDFEPSHTPTLRTVRPDSPDGRGLVLVDALTDRWGYDLLGPAGRPSRKRVWAELLVDAKPAEGEQ
ncbi:ATP-binding protein [Streptomyces spectabilis]|uniref:ATP-binding protein n=1 Tax=Streptomyces spectabilis TaxID=68270 RepID=A0A516RAY4_STRST|nr:ATP-binding protein [Streptomyces spectabilis]QDQ12819.1 ATP-binding protein [Streptomyces spectabilis]